METNIEKYFDAGAVSWLDDTYGSNRTIASPRQESIVSILRRLKPESFLDVGCGDGRLLQILDFIPHRMGIDISDNMLKIARDRNPTVEFCQIGLDQDNLSQDIEKLGSFDFLSMMGVIHYLESPLVTLSKLRGCVSFDGKLLVSFRNRLFNTNASSKYFDSEMNQARLSHLQREVSFWENAKSAVGKVEWALDDSGELRGFLDDGPHQFECEGVTDNFWNPDNFENWRQFTPCDAILLFEKAGFRADRLFGLSASEATQTLIKDCSAFLLLGSLESGAGQ